jgi:stress response protein YsnF
MATRAKVTDEAGEVGRLVTDVLSGERAGTLSVAFGNGRRAVVPHERVTVTDDGTYRLDGRFDEFEMSEPRPRARTPSRNETSRDGTSPPDNGGADMTVAREHLNVSRQRRPLGRVLVHKQVDTEEFTLDDHIDFEEAKIERVPIERVVDEPPRVRQDGDTVVIPVLEERLVKQLVLVEEVHVRRVRHSQDVSEPVTLRREHIDIERQRTDSGNEPGESRPS